MPPSGIHHLAIATRNMKATLEFYCGVLELRLTGLFEMHGVPGAIHAFLELGDGRQLSFIEFPQKKEAAAGITFAAWPGDSTPPGTMQHVALDADNRENLERLQTRLSDAGFKSSQIVDHGFCQSLYLEGPDHVCLELSYTTRGLDRRELSMNVVAECGISEAELARFQAGSTSDG